jgi:hypothetical protein
VFNWFKRNPQVEQPKEIATRFRHHFSAAEGSQIQRGCIAAAMVAIEEEPVQKQRNKLPAKDQIIFMMTYECFVMWAFKQGLEKVLKPADVGPVIVAMHRHFAKHAFYQPDAFAKIWDKMQVLMPKAMAPAAKGVICPAADMLRAANLAGYPLEPTIGADLEFGAFVSKAIGELVTRAQAQAMPSVCP